MAGHHTRANLTIYHPIDHMTLGNIIPEPLNPHPEVESGRRCPSRSSVMQSDTDDQILDEPGTSDLSQSPSDDVSLDHEPFPDLDPRTPSAKSLIAQLKCLATHLASLAKSKHGPPLAQRIPDKLPDDLVSLLKHPSAGVQVNAVLATTHLLHVYAPTCPLSRDDLSYYFSTLISVIAKHQGLRSQLFESLATSRSILLLCDLPKPFRDFVYNALARKWYADSDPNFFKCMAILLEETEMIMDDTLSLFLNPLAHVSHHLYGVPLRQTKNPVSSQVQALGEFLRALVETSELFQRKLTAYVMDCADKAWAMEYDKMIHERMLNAPWVQQFWAMVTLYSQGAEDTVGERLVQGLQSSVDGERAWALHMSAGLVLVCCRASLAHGSDEDKEEDRSRRSGGVGSPSPSARSLSWRYPRPSLLSLKKSFEGRRNDRNSVIRATFVTYYAELYRLSTETVEKRSPSNTFVPAVMKDSVELPSRILHVKIMDKDERVRCQAMEHCPIVPELFEALSSRQRDTCASVRKKAFRLLPYTMDVHVLGLAQRTSVSHGHIAERTFLMAAFEKAQREDFGWILGLSNSDLEKLCHWLRKRDWDLRNYGRRLLRPGETSKLERICYKLTEGFPDKARAKLFESLVTKGRPRLKTIWRRLLDDEVDVRTECEDTPEAQESAHGQTDHRTPPSTAASRSNFHALDLENEFSSLTDHRLSNVFLRYAITNGFVRPLLQRHCGDPKVHLIVSRVSPGILNVGLLRIHHSRYDLASLSNYMQARKRESDGGAKQDTHGVDLSDTLKLILEYESDERTLGWLATIYALARNEKALESMLSETSSRYITMVKLAKHWISLFEQKRITCKDPRVLCNRITSLHQAMTPWKYIEVLALPALTYMCHKMSLEGKLGDAFRKYTFKLVRQVPAMDRYLTATRLRNIFRFSSELDVDAHKYASSLVHMHLKYAAMVGQPRKDPEEQAVIRVWRAWLGFQDDIDVLVREWMHCPEEASSEVLARVRAVLGDLVDDQDLEPFPEEQESERQERWARDSGIHSSSQGHEQRVIAREDEDENLFLEEVSRVTPPPISGRHLWVRDFNPQSLDPALSSQPEDSSRVSLSDQSAPSARHPAPTKDSPSAAQAARPVKRLKLAATSLEHCATLDPLRASQSSPVACDRDDVSMFKENEKGNA